MRTLTLLLFIIACCQPIFGQRVQHWYRVYTFEDSRIEMDTSKVILGGDIGRLTFRWIFDQPRVVNGEPRLRYTTREETIEFRCSDRLYRIFETALLDSSGRVLRSELMRPPYQWHPINLGSVMGTISIPACELINRELKPSHSTRTPYSRPEPDEQAVLEKASDLAFSFVQTLQRSRDFKPVIRKFFATDYLKRYLDDPETNWFLNLDRHTAAKASPAELERYYVAALNAAYLSSLYLISQSQPHHEPSSESVAEERLVPKDVIQIVKNHPYSTDYKRGIETFDYLAESIDTVPQMRSYTELMEKVAMLMRLHVVQVNAERSDGYRELLENWDPHSRVLICSTRCLGLPKGSKLFEVHVPIFHLQLAEIRGQLKIVSVLDQSSESNH